VVLSHVRGVVVVEARERAVVFAVLVLDFMASLPVDVPTDPRAREVVGRRYPHPQCALAERRAVDDLVGIAIGNGDGPMIVEPVIDNMAIAAAMLKAVDRKGVG